MLNLQSIFVTFLMVIGVWATLPPDKGLIKLRLDINDLEGVDEGSIRFSVILPTFGFRIPLLQQDQFWYKFDPNPTENIVVELKQGGNTFSEDVKLDFNEMPYNSASPPQALTMDINLENIKDGDGVLLKSTVVLKVLYTPGTPLLPESDNTDTEDNGLHETASLSSVSESDSTSTTSSTVDPLTGSTTRTLKLGLWINNFLMSPKVKIRVEVPKWGGGGNDVYTNEDKGTTDDEAEDSEKAPKKVRSSSRVPKFPRWMTKITSGVGHMVPQFHKFKYYGMSDIRTITFTVIHDGKDPRSAKISISELVKNKKLELDLLTETEKPELAPTTLNVGSFIASKRNQVYFRMSKNNAKNPYSTQTKYTLLATFRDSDIEIPPATYWGIQPSWTPNVFQSKELIKASKDGKPFKLEILKDLSKDPDYTNDRPIFTSQLFIDPKTGKFDEANRHMTSSGYEIETFKAYHWAHYLRRGHIKVEFRILDLVDQNDLENKYDEFLILLNAIEPIVTSLSSSIAYKGYQYPDPGFKNYDSYSTLRREELGALEKIEKELRSNLVDLGSSEDSGVHTVHPRVEEELRATLLETPNDDDSNLNAPSSVGTTAKTIIPMRESLSSAFKSVIDGVSSLKGMDTVKQAWSQISIKAADDQKILKVSFVITSDGKGLEDPSLANFCDVAFLFDVHGLDVSSYNSETVQVIPYYEKLSKYGEETIAETLRGIRQHITGRLPMWIAKHGEKSKKKKLSPPEEATVVDSAKLAKVVEEGTVVDSAKQTEVVEEGTVVKSAEQTEVVEEGTVVDSAKQTEVPESELLTTTSVVDVQVSR